MRTFVTPTLALLTLLSAPALAAPDILKLRYAVPSLKVGTPVVPNEPAAPPAEVIATSCRDLLQKRPATASGWHTLDVDTTGPVQAQPYYCDMQSAGGGWTRIVRQTETQPVPSWTGGVNGDSYTLSSSSIPAHTQVAFGKDEEATFAAYFNWTYTTGDVNPPAELTALHDGQKYRIGRSLNGTWGQANPYLGYMGPISENQWGDGDWRNGLLVSRMNTSYTWAFCAKQQTPNFRGCAMGGATLGGSAEAYAWTVWVR